MGGAEGRKKTISGRNKLTLGEGWMIAREREREVPGLMALIIEQEDGTEALSSQRLYTSVWELRSVRLCVCESVWEANGWCVTLLRPTLCVLIAMEVKIALNKSHQLNSTSTTNSVCSVTLNVKNCVYRRIYKSQKAFQNQWRHEQISKS